MVAHTIANIGVSQEKRRRFLVLRSEFTQSLDIFLHPRVLALHLHLQHRQHPFAQEVVAIALQQRRAHKKRRIVGRREMRMGRMQRDSVLERGVDLPELVDVGEI